MKFVNRAVSRCFQSFRRVGKRVGMKARKDVFQLFGIIRSNSRDIFRVGEFMTEHNLGKWDHIIDGQGKTFTFNGHQVAVFNIDKKCGVKKISIKKPIKINISTHHFGKRSNALIWFRITILICHAGKVIVKVAIMISIHFVPYLGLYNSFE